MFLLGLIIGGFMGVVIMAFLIGGNKDE